MKSELIKGDSLQELKKYDDNSIDLLCTDPPYGYSFMGRDWDKTLPPKEITIFTRRKTIFGWWCNKRIKWVRRT